MTTTPRVRIFHGDHELSAVPADDRGFAYGDGLFETMRAHDGRLPWWPAHRARLERDAARLGIPLPPADRLADAMHAMLPPGDAVVRLQLTRGPGPRGYAPVAGSAPLWVLSVSPPPPSKPTVALRWCSTRLALQPALAGIKHCNRLEQVLARSEWSPGDADIDEGLMLDIEGHVVCATSANVFVLRDGVWITPPVDRCGVRGVCRDWLLDAADAREERLVRADVERAEAVVLCNAVRGILEATRLGALTWAPHPRVARLRGRLAAAHPAFAQTPEFP